MAKIRVGINGFGRIGRNFFRAHLAAGRRLRDRRRERPRRRRRCWRTCSVTTRRTAGSKASSRAATEISVGDFELQVLAERDPKALPWGDLGVDVVLESTASSPTREGARSTSTPARRRSSSRRPPRSRTSPSCSASTTTATTRRSTTSSRTRPARRTASAPLAKVLHDNFGIEPGFMTTIHAYTKEQQLLRTMPAQADLRRARAAAINLIPTSTGAARAIGVVVPELKGKLDGMAMRVPGPRRLGHRPRRHARREATAETRSTTPSAEARHRPLGGVLAVHGGADRLRPTSSATRVLVHLRRALDDGARQHGRRCFGWYDNEWGYSLPARRPDRIARAALTE